MHRAAKQVVNMTIKEPQRRPRVSITTERDLSYAVN